MTIIRTHGRVIIHIPAQPNAGTYLCQAPAAFARDGHEPAELWGRVIRENKRDRFCRRRPTYATALTPLPESCDFSQQFKLNKEF
jgi:hypothetical protein